MEIRSMGAQRPVTTAIALNRKQQNKEQSKGAGEALAAALAKEEDRPAESIGEMRARELREAQERRDAAAEERRQKQLQKEQDKLSQLEMLHEELVNSNKEAEAMGESFKVYSRCLTIASRIARGDSVPMKDMKYLAEHEPDMFKQAILLRVPNDHPKKHKSVLEDEEENESTESTEGGEEASPDIAQPEAPAPAEIPEEIAAEE